MKKVIATLALTILSSSAFAASSIQKWQGSGTAYTPAGAQLGTYNVTIVNTEVSPALIQSESTIRFADGSTSQISQKLAIHGGQWSDESNLGKGGGACYGADVCENYIAGKNGMAYATTILKDGADRERQITTVLQNGRAVKLLRLSLIRVQ